MCLWMKMTCERTTRTSQSPQTLSAAFTRGWLCAPGVTRGAGLPLVKARAFQAREKQPHRNDGFGRGSLHPAKERRGPARLCAHKSRLSDHEIRQTKCHTMQGNSQRISLKTNDWHPHKVSHLFE